MSVLQQIAIENSDGENEIRIVFTANKKGNFAEIPIPNLTGQMEMICYYEDGSSTSFEGAEDTIQGLEDLINKGVIRQSPNKYENPVIKYMDITEEELLGSEPIMQENLMSKDHGLWANAGKRKLKVSFSKTECFGKEAYIRVNFKTVDGEECSVQNFSSEQVPLVGEEVILTLDTDLLGKAFTGENENKKHLQFGGRIEVLCSYGRGQEVRYEYPIGIVVINTDPKVFDMISDAPASIDFGTSSTCVAIMGDEGLELLSLSEREDDTDNMYENPTNIMLFNWENIYKEWREENDDSPIIYKGDKQDYLRYSNNPSEFNRVDFDFGYSVKRILGYEETDKRELNAILTLIKMIPYQLLKENEQLQVNPYENRNKFIDIVAEPREQDETHLDPVAFYGYLIGRAINDISKHSKIYTEFQVTSPVMFNEEIKQRLHNSLEYGLKRAVPKQMRKIVKVSMEHTEPVAYIGALCGTDYFSINDGEEKLFAVYDFGGGTLDFSYGIASSNEDGDTKIHVLRVGGKENIGGERLIERLVFQIYLYNIHEMKDNNIPIEKPYGELLPDELPEKMVRSTDYTRANRNIISAQIARKIFEGRELPDKNNRISLYDMEGEQHSVQISYDEDELEAGLEVIIKETIQTFKEEMDEAFKGVKGYHPKDVHIFKAGNSSRSVFVQENMDEMFKGNPNIKLVDQIADGSVQYERYAITPKTAVAFGQLKLNNFTVEGDTAYFKYYVGFFKEGNGEFKVCIDKNDPVGVWKRYRAINNNQMDVFYATSKPDRTERVKTPWKALDVKEHKGEILYVRIKDESTIEYCMFDGELEEIGEDVQVYVCELREK